MYNRTFLSKTELEDKLSQKLDPMQVQLVGSGYDMAENVHEYQVRNDGTPYFYHSTRVAKILLDELGIYDTDILLGALLHDVLEDSDVITKEVLDYNYGAYVAYLVETLTKDIRAKDPDAVDLAHIDVLKKAPEDCLVIRLAARLDNFRCLSFNLKRNPFHYVQQTSQRYIPLAENSTNKHLQYLVGELKKERNKFFG